MAESLVAQFTSKWPNIWLHNSHANSRIYGCTIHIQMAESLVAQFTCKWLNIWLQNSHENVSDPLLCSKLQSQTLFTAQNKNPTEIIVVVFGGAQQKMVLLILFGEKRQHYNGLCTKLQEGEEKTATQLSCQEILQDGCTVPVFK